MAQDLDTARYARHLLLPEIGRAGQERLLAADVHEVEGADEGALAVAREYLVRAGVALGGERNRQGAKDAKGRQEGQEWVDAARASGLVPRIGDLGASGMVLRVPGEHEVEALAGRPELLEAARALSGALSAVECVKSVLGLGEAQSVEPPTLSSEEV